MPYKESREDFFPLRLQHRVVVALRLQRLSEDTVAATLRSSGKIAVEKMCSRYIPCRGVPKKFSGGGT